MLIAGNAVVVFDLDDTLYPEMQFVQSGFWKVASALRAEDAKALYEEMMGLYAKGKYPFQEMIDKHGCALSVKEMLEIYRNHRPCIQLRPGVKQLLARLKTAGHPAGLITDGRSITQRNKLRALALDAYFDDIIISEEFGSAKPSAENYQYFMDKYPGKAYYYIGDNFRKDFITPNKLKWTTIGFLDGGMHVHKQDVDLPAVYLPRHRINSFSEISLP